MTQKKNYRKKGQDYGSKMSDRLKARKRLGFPIGGAPMGGAPMGGGPMGGAPMGGGGSPH